jgi:carbon starvation protein
MRAFIDGAALFISSLGIPLQVGQAFVALVAVSFALTSLDSGTRLLRYNIEEIADSFRLPYLGNRYLASVIAVCLIGFFAFYEVNGQPAGLALWSLFGSTNQVLGGLTLLAVTVYLRQQGRNYWYTFVPMAFMMLVTMIAMVIDLQRYWGSGNLLLTFVAACIFLLSVWLAIEAVIRFRAPTPGHAAVLEGAEGD